MVIAIFGPGRAEAVKVRIDRASSAEETERRKERGEESVSDERLFRMSVCFEVIVLLRMTVLLSYYITTIRKNKRNK